MKSNEGNLQIVGIPLIGLYSNNTLQKHATSLTETILTKSENPQKRTEEWR